jgi:glycine/D-amino acid oxidase-like deaminating enzyme
MSLCDVAIIGAGAAGLFCAGIAAQQGLSVVLIDHSPKLAEKIRISGGGRSNFTNKDIDPQAPHRHFLGDNPMLPAAPCRATRRKTSLPWSKATAWPFTKNTKVSCFATARHKT